MRTRTFAMTEFGSVYSEGVHWGAICTPQEFEQNLKLDFASIRKRKGAIDYLPWASIVRALHQHVDGCTYGFVADKEGKIIYYTPDGGAYVRPYLVRARPTTTEAVPLGWSSICSPPGFFPITNMASRHAAIVGPDIRQIDNCLRRAIAKEIGVHTGIGLGMWSNEDPYDASDEEPPAIEYGKAASPPVVNAVRSFASILDPSIAFDEAAHSAGLTLHGRETVARAVKAGSFELIPAGKFPAITELLGQPEFVKLFNSGRNSKGKEIHPLNPGKGDPVESLAKAFQGCEIPTEQVDLPKASVAFSPNPDTAADVDLLPF